MNGRHTIAKVNESAAVQGKKNEIRLLTLTPFFPSENNEASGCFVSEPLDALSRMKVVNTVIAVQPLYRRHAEVRSGGLSAEWVRYPSLPGGTGLSSAGAFLFARILERVRRLQKSGGADLIHAHAPLPCGHAAMLLSRELGIPYVVSVHGLDAFSTEQVRGRAGQWCKRISERVYAASKRVICISERVRDQVLDVMGRACRTSVVYNGVDPNVFSPAAELASQMSILSVGNLIPIKGHDTLLRAFASLVPDFPELSLRIIGEGPELARLRQLGHEFNVHERVHFVGRQSRAQVAEAMRNCTIFALPSRYEGLGCVYLEAMSSGKAVIGCRGQGIAEVIQHGSNGFLVGPDNERELSLAMSMLLRDPDRRRNLGQQARDTILDRFTLTHQAERLARIYRECVA